MLTVKLILLTERNIIGKSTLFKILLLTLGCFARCVYVNRRVKLQPSTGVFFVRHVECVLIFLSLVARSIFVMKYVYN